MSIEQDFPAELPLTHTEVLILVFSLCVLQNVKLVRVKQSYIYKVKFRLGKEFIYLEDGGTHLIFAIQVKKKIGRKIS